MPHGHTARRLHVDLTTGEIRTETVDEVTARRELGGTLYAAGHLLAATPAGLDPFDPAAVLVIATSVVAGLPAPGLPRVVFAAKSPLTGALGEARAEGPFGIALKRSGFDAVTVTGRAAEPVYLHLDAGAAVLRPAAGLWGLDTARTTDGLTDRHGPDACVATIGPAGEHLVRYASVVTARAFTAPRTGIGAVLGAKRLKAVVCTGGELPAVADPAAVAALARAYAADMAVNPLATAQHDVPGFGAWPGGEVEAGYLGVRNYADTAAPELPGLAPGRFPGRLVWDSGGCPGCPNDCVKGFAPADTRLDTRSAGLHQEAVAALGANLGIDDLDTVLEANLRCTLLGLDPVSLGFTLSCAMEAVRAGLVDPARLGDPALPGFGDPTALVPLVEAVARRTGVGDLLAEGALRFARAAGPGVEALAMQVKGLELPSFEPRTQTGLALGYAVSPTGPRYDVCEHDLDFDTGGGWPHSLDGARTVGVLERTPMAEHSTRRAARTKQLLILWSACEALVVCPFASAPTRPLSLDRIAALVSAVTGWEFSAHEVMRAGERRLHLLRLYAVREGLGPADDRLPDRFFDEPVTSGRHLGTRLDRAGFDRMREQLCAMLGWGPDGRPLPHVLADHGLADHGLAEAGDP